jgi:Transposase DDE domain
VHPARLNYADAPRQKSAPVPPLRKKVEMLFAHLKRILKLDRLRLRGPMGARDEFLLAATAQNLRKLAKLISMPSPHPA